MYDYALLKLSKKIDLGNKLYFRPTIFGCSPCLSSEDHEQMLKIYGYPIYEDNFATVNKK